jgi:hypothetical protein
MEILFNSYLEAKTKANELMKEERVMYVHLGKRRFQPKWFVDYRVCSDNYYEEYIKKSLTNDK